MRVVMHLDVNSAFLSWTAVDLIKKGGKDIRDEVAIIGGDEEARHGIVLAASIPAKKMGIKTAMSLYEVRKIAPNIKIYPSNYKLYEEMSNKLFNLISKYTPDIEKFSIDECFIDYTPVLKLHGDPIKFAYKLKEEIKTSLGFTVNIGIANNKLCAKMASDFEKPDKVHTLYMDEVKSKMWPLDVGELLWIGKKTKIKLNELGIKTIGDLANTDPANIYHYFKNQTNSMIEHANGIDNDLVITKMEEAKGMSKMITLSHDVLSRNELYECLNYISNDLGMSLRANKKFTSCIAIILKDNYFKMRTHQMTLPNRTNKTKDIYEYSKKLLDDLWKGEAIRLVGLRLDNLSSNGIHQYSIFDDTSDLKDETLDRVMDNLKGKYGTKIINKASLLKK